MHAPQPGDRTRPGYRQGDLALRPETLHAEGRELQGLGAHDLPWRGEATPSTTDASATASLATDNAPTGRLVATGQENQCPRRIFLPTADTRLIALNADTGKMCEDFGDKGQIDLGANIGTFAPGGYYSTSPPAVTRNLVVIGGHVTDNVSTRDPCLRRANRQAGVELG